MTNKELLKFINEYANKIGSNISMLKVDNNKKEINAWVKNNETIGISKRLYNMCINEEPGYKEYFSRLMGHELIHIKHNDNSNRLIHNYIPTNTSKMICLLTELRADIEGKVLIPIDDNKYKEIMKEALSEEKFSKDKNFNYGYPSYEERIYFTDNYDKFTKKVIDEALERYDEYKVNKNKILKFFNYPTQDQSLKL